MASVASVCHRARTGPLATGFQKMLKRLSVIKIYPLVTEIFRHRQSLPQEVLPFPRLVLISTGLACNWHYRPAVVPGTMTKGRKRFRLSFSREVPIFQSLFRSVPTSHRLGLKRHGKTAQMSSQIDATADDVETRRLEDSSHAVSLSGSLFHQYVTQR